MANVTIPSSVFHRGQSPNLTDKYQHINTGDIVNAMKSEGWFIADAQASKPYKKDPLHARHMVDLRHPDLPDETGEGVPRIIIVNSHDGTKAATAYSGFFRFVCENGLVIGNRHSITKTKHMGHTALEFAQRALRLGPELKSTVRTFDRWGNIELDRSARFRYARKVSELRWGHNHPYDPADLLTVRREEDDSGTLLETYNRVQENSMKGGQVGKNRNGRQVRSRRLTDIDRSMKFNADLWALTDEFAA